MSAPTLRHEPVGGPLWTRPVQVLTALAVLGAALVVWRFAVGLGPATALSDGYPFGLWIAFDVVTGTALACGGYAVAILVYVFNRGRYHHLVRPAILTSALGYSLAGFAIVVDVGRPWHMWKVPLFFWEWNLDSALLEVALCIMAYVLVLWIELSPAFLERWEASHHERLARFARTTRPAVEKILLWVIALGLLLPTMHQSSLGTLMLLAGPKLHPLWASSMVPLLFLLTAIAMGYAVVAFEATLAGRFFGRRVDRAMLGSLGLAALVVLAVWVVVRLVDAALRGVLSLALEPTAMAAWFWAEVALAVAALVLLVPRAARGRTTRILQVALLIVLQGALYRFVTYLVAYDPGPQWSYVPAIPEIFVTVGFVAAEILAYIVLVKRFPILAGRRATASPPPAGLGAAARA